MAESAIQFRLTENEPMQTEPKFFSSVENTASQRSMSDQCLTEDAEAQNEILNHFVVHPKEHSNAVQVTFSKYGAVLIEPSLSMTTKSGSEPTKNLPNVSMATTSYHAQSRPHVFETS